MKNIYYIASLLLIATSCAFAAIPVKIVDLSTAVESTPVLVLSNGVFQTTKNIQTLEFPRDLYPEPLGPYITDLRIQGQTMNKIDYVYSDSTLSFLISGSYSTISTYNIDVRGPSGTVQSFMGEATEPATSLTITRPLNLEDGTYSIRIRASNHDGNTALFESQSFTVTSALKITNLLNAPNPFNPNQSVSHIQYSLTKDAAVSGYLHSISGERLWQFEALPGTEGGKAGFNSVTWSGTNSFGEQVANGAYILYLVFQADGHKEIKKTKILVLK
ncbi:MAG: hypothetical protein AB7F28_02710 [Candidatus Margulisiibacteriota bacterium]